MTENKKPKFFYGYVVVGAAFLIMTVAFGTALTFGIFFKPLIAEFGWTRAMTSGAYSLHMLLYAFFSIATGRASDKFGPRIIVVLGGCFLGLGLLLMSQISAIWQLYLFYGGIAAIGSGSVFVPSVSTIARWFVKRRGLMTGIVVSGTGLGTLIIPPIASWLISVYGWRTSYYILGIMVLVLIILAAQFLKRDPSQAGLLPYGEGEVNQGSSNWVDKGFSPQEAMRTRQFWMVGVMFFCYGFSLQTIMVHIVPHATDLGISVISAANILATIGGASIVGKIMMGGAGDRIGNKTVIIICFVLLSVILFWLQLAKMVWMLYLFAAVFGFAYGGFVALRVPLVAELFGLSSHGVILGITQLSIGMGEAAGPVVSGHIFDIMGSYNLAFLICATLSIVAAIITLLLKPTTSQGGRNDSERSHRLY